MKKIIISLVSILISSIGFAQSGVSLDIIVEGPDPCTGEYTFINNSSGTAVDAGTVEYYWSGPWNGTITTTDLTSPPNVVIPETATCNQPGVTCYGISYSVFATNTADNTAGGFTANDALARYDAPGSCMLIELINASIDSTFCLGDTLIFNASTDGSLYDDFNWDASTLGNIVTGQGTNTITVVVTSDNGGRVTATDNAGCGVSSFLVVDTRDCCDQVTADFNVTQLDPCTPIANLTDVSTGTVETWVWTFGDGHTLNSNGHAGTDQIVTADNNGGLTSGTYANPIHDYSTMTGQYAITITLLTEGVGGCSISAASASDMYFGGPEPVTADFDVAQLDPCLPIANLTDQSSGDVETWVWTFGDGHTLNSNGHAGTDQIVTADNNGGLTSGTYANPIHDYSNWTGQYAATITLLTEGVGGCSISAASASDMYFGGPEPVTADFSFTQPDACTPIVHFTDETTGDAETWYWTFGDGHTLNSTGHLGTDQIDPADNNGGLTSGTYANPIHDYSSLNGTVYAITITLIVDGVGQCSVSGVSASDNYFHANCCQNSGIYGLKDDTFYNFTIEDENNVYNSINPAGCAFPNPSQLQKGGSTIDNEGTYYYTDGSSIQIMNNANCTNTFLTGSSYTNINELEYNPTTESLWMIANDGTNNFLVEVEIPTLQGSSTNMNILQSIVLGTNDAVAGSSTLDVTNQTYYYVLANFIPSQTASGNIIIGEVMEVDLTSGNTRIIEVKDMDGVHPNAAVYTANSNIINISNFSPSVQELEVTASGLVALAKHYKEEEKDIYFEPGPNGTLIHIPNHEVHVGNGGQLENEHGQPLIVQTIKLATETTDVVEMNIPTGNGSAQASIVVSGVSYDGYTSSTYNSQDGLYYFTDYYGSKFYTVDVSAGTFSMQDGAISGSKNVHDIFEIEYLKCDQQSSARKASSETIQEETEKVSTFEAKVFPNPSNTGNYTINVNATNEENVNIQVIDFEGRPIISDMNITNTHRIDLSDKAKGTYFVIIESGDSKEVKKLIYQ